MVKGHYTPHEQDDANAVDHLLTCPRCSALCEPDCRYCAECGSRLLPTEVDLRDLRGLQSPSGARP